MMKKKCGGKVKKYQKGGKVDPATLQGSKNEAMGAAMGRKMADEMAKKKPAPKKPAMPPVKKKK